MLHLNAEVMAISWRGKPNRQEDAILINGKILQHAGSRITPVYQPTDSLCVAVADGVHNSPVPHNASKQVLSSVLKQHLAGRQVRLSSIQTDLCQALADHPNSYGSSATLALVESVAAEHSNKQQPNAQQLRISHVGDSRVCHYQHGYGWRPVTEDHTTLAALSKDQNIKIDQAVEYASMYAALNHYFVADWADNNTDGLSSGQFMTVQAGDWILLSTDGMHDILPCQEWPEINADTNLAEWLKQIHDTVHRKGAYDNGSVVVTRWTTRTDELSTPSESSAIHTDSPQQPHNIWAFGDVHGNLTALKTLWQAMQPNADDQIYFLGDYVDRGLDSRGVLDFLIALQGNYPKMHCILGNHEEMLLRCYESADADLWSHWLRWGGIETLISYGFDADALLIAQNDLDRHTDVLWTQLQANMPAAHTDFLYQLLPYVETPAYVFSHACPTANLAMPQHSTEALRWTGQSTTEPLLHGQQAIFGHLSQLSGQVTAYGVNWCIDTSVTGWISAFNPESKVAHQANQRGEYRCQGLH